MSKKKKKQNPYNEKKVALWGTIGILVVFLFTFLFVLWATRETQDSVSNESTEITEEATTEDLTKYIDEETGFFKKDDFTYYYPEGPYQDYYTGWYKTNGTRYYFDEDGHMAVGPTKIEEKDYYFKEDGSLACLTWIDDHYYGKNGAMLKNAVTDDNHYVNAEGIKDDEVSVAHSKEGLNDLKDILEEKMSHYSGTWSIYVKNLDTNEYLIINDEQQYTASLIKLFCAATIYDLIDKGKLERNERIDNLLTAMISVSDNDAFNLLVRECDVETQNHVKGREVIQEYLDANGYENTTIATALYPTAYAAPSSPGRNNTTTLDCGLILEKIYKRQVVSPEYSKEFMDLLLNQQRRAKIPAGLPQGTKCGNKTGETDRTEHDAAIVFSPNATYIITVMSTNCGSAIGNINDLSATTYEYFNPEE